MNMSGRSAGFFILVTLFITVAYLISAEQIFKSEFLKVSFLNVGQGDSILIQAPNGNQLLIDGGPSSSVLTRIGKRMPFYDRSVDALIVSNPDKDHLGGFVEILDRYEVSRVIESGTFNPAAVYASFGKKIDEKNIPRHFLKSGDRIMIDKKRGIFLDILFPDRNPEHLDTNSGSLVARLVFGEVCFMLMGDAPRGVEEYLTLLYGDYIDCQVLKVGHHGSRTSSSKKFVEAVSPIYSVISVGKDNSYGHPHNEVLETLESVGGVILRTDELSDIDFETNGKVLIKK